MSDEPQISVVIPLYNKGPHIRRAVESVLNQTSPVSEIVIVDDGSTDNSVVVVQGLKCDLVRLMQQENGGVSVARNAGITHAKHSLIAFLDADDEWLPHHVETLKRLYVKHPECGAFASARAYGEEGKDVRPARYHGIPEGEWEGVIPNYFKAALGTPPIWSSTVMVRKDAFDKAGLFPVGERVGEDLDMWSRIALHYQIAFSRKVSAIKYKDTVNASRHYGMEISKYGALLETLEAVLRDHTPLLPGMEYDDIREFRDAILINVATEKVIVGQSREARAMLVRAKQSRLHAKLLKKWLFLSYIPSGILRLFWNLKSAS
jgi:glycosyltransferase involved in cell wall biosynthesis